jgi:hypothetical protein
MWGGSWINAYFGDDAPVSGIRYCITQRRKGAKEGKKTISFSSSLRLCGFV